jgi:hypothetical protein
MRVLSVSPLLPLMYLRVMGKRVSTGLRHRKGFTHQSDYCVNVMVANVTSVMPSI